MTHLLRKRRPVAWIAILAMLLAALAPSLALALAPPQQAMPWEEICSVGGPQVVRDAASASGSGQHAAMGYKHCLFCLNHGGATAVPSSPLKWRPLVAVDIECSTFVALVSSARFIRATAQPRAPPSIS